MGRIIVGTGLGGIAGITALAYWLNYRRQAYGCQWGYDLCIQYVDRSQLDRITVTGLCVALAFLLASLCVAAILKARRGSTPVKPVNGWRPANRGQTALPR